MRVLHEVTGLHREPSGLQFKDFLRPKTRKKNALIAFIMRTLIGGKRVRFAEGLLD